jgi:hypothetical protein
MRITNDPKSLETMLYYIDDTIAIHNMLIEFRNGEEDNDALWMEV